MGEFASVNEAANSPRTHLGTVRVPLAGTHLREEEMGSNQEHQKRPSATDQKFRTDDEHIHEMDKQHLKESEKDAGFIPKPNEKQAADKKE
jgi:hypothetical protein